VSLARDLLLLQSQLAWNRFTRLARDPAPAYDRAWRKTRTLLSRAPFWNRRPIASRLEDYPITTFEEYEPFLQQAFQRGSTCPFNAGRIRSWCTSSGTTGPRKAFPITFASLSQFGESIAVYNRNVFRVHPDYLKRPVLALIAGASGERSPAGAPIGYGTNLFYPHTPAVLCRRNALPRDLPRIPGGVESWTAVYALATDIGAIASVASRSLLTFLEYIDRNVEAILRHWRDSRSTLPPGVRPPPRDPARWRHVNRVLARPDWSMKELWPHLGGIQVWTGGPCAPDAATLRARAGPGVAFFETFNGASEGLIAVPIEGARGAGVVSPFGPILEFLPAGADLDPRNLLKPWELQEGQDYEVFLTTWMAFVRYRIKDVLRCVGRFGRLPVIAFRYKADHQIRLTLASVSEHDLLEACRRIGIRPADETLFSPTESCDGLILWTA
jgi:hypothetical protein